MVYDPPTGYGPLPRNHQHVREHERLRTVGRRLAPILLSSAGPPLLQRSPSVGGADDIKYGTVKEAPPNLIYVSVFHAPGGASASVATIQIRSRFPAGDVAGLVRERISGATP